MITLRKSEERGHADHGWLDTYHTFSFADYYDPREMGFGALRVINEDRVEPGTGFGRHGHRDMEIITYILEGALEHQDSMGNGSVIRPGDVQRMSAGHGVLHSEYNPSREEPVHLLQIWIEPDVRGVTPGYEQKHFAPAEKQGRLRLIASPDGRDGSVAIHQDARVYATLLDGTEFVTHRLAPRRRAYVHVTRGAVEIAGHPLKAGDGAKVAGETEVTLASAKDAEALLFDLP
ncbi:MAG: pirin family protein [Betaproteobacteria bacterium]|nr:pirin family protein [Betaproteobacteria bacterium]MBI3936579.1 pirin family protein [Betaproteobacteria bacterium]